MEKQPVKEKWEALVDLPKTMTKGESSAGHFKRQAQKGGCRLPNRPPSLNPTSLLAIDDTLMDIASIGPSYLSAIAFVLSQVEMADMVTLRHN